MPVATRACSAPHTPCQRRVARARAGRAAPDGDAASPPVRTVQRRKEQSPTSMLGLASVAAAPRTPGRSRRRRNAALEYASPGGEEGTDSGSGHERDGEAGDRRSQRPVRPAVGEVTDRAHNNQPRRGGAGREKREERRGRGGTTVGRGGPTGGRRNDCRPEHCAQRSGPRPAARAGGAAWPGRDDRRPGRPDQRPSQRLSAGAIRPADEATNGGRGRRSGRSGVAGAGRPATPGQRPAATTGGRSEGAERRAILRVLFLGKGDGGAAASFLSLSLGPDCVDLAQL